MFKKIVFEIICVAIILLEGCFASQPIQEEAIQENAVETKEETIAQEEASELEETEDERAINENEEIEKVDFLEQSKNIDNTAKVEDKKPESQIKNETQNSCDSKTNTTNTKQNEKNTNEQNTQKKEENKKQETAQVQQITEEYIYNDTATKKMMNDIDTIAKKNPDLWGKNGEKLYKIQKCPSLVGKNYMYPYSYAQLEGQVLNVYPVTFLVYAIDYKKTGFATETRYYIDITNY